MKLEFDTLTLGDDSTGDKITDHGGEHTRTVQREDLAGGTTPFLRGQGNRTNQRSFTVDKVHETAQAAVEWFNTHAEELPDQGTLRISEGAFAAEMFAVVATVSRVELNGRTTLLRYQFLGQQMTPGV